MNKKVFIIIALIAILSIGLFTLTGCGTKEDTNSSNTGNLESTETNSIENTVSNNETSTNKKVEFTKTVFLEDFNIKYKLPENSISEYDFEDMGCNIMIDVGEHETDDFLLHTNDSHADKIETTNINGYSYEHYKYSYDEDSVTYIYRTQANGKYYKFDYNVNGMKNYDDSQVEKFMNTVEFITE